MVNVRLSAMATGFVSAVTGRPPAPRMVTRSSGRRGSPQRDEDRGSSSQRDRSRSPRRNNGTTTLSALELLNARQPPVFAPEMVADGPGRNGGNERGPPGFHGEGRISRGTVDPSEPGENAPARQAPTVQAQDRNDGGPAQADRENRESARADRNPRDSVRADRERDSARANRERDPARGPRQNLDPARADRRPDSANRRANQGEQQDPRNQAAGISEIAEIIARLDPASQHNLRRIFPETAGDRGIARSSASTGRRAAENNSARYTDINIGAAADNNDAIRHAIGLLAALQRGNNGDPAAAADPVRPAAPAAPRSRAPLPLDPEGVDDGDHTNFENLDEGNPARPKAPAPLNLAPIPPARPQLRSSLVKSDGIRTQLFSFERIQAIARHAFSILPSQGVEQLADYLQQIIDEAEEKIHFLFTADQRGFEVANMALKIKYGEVVEDKNVKAATQIVAASKKRPHMPATSTRPNPAPRNRGQGERHWTWRRDGDGRCFYCREPGHGIADCPQRGQGANQPAKIV
ncbi:unnamed protein product [Closterium sp. Yama58-4]|nr:unnamed protein product [Closterium sp. Yama58-4]